jgi:hypothetical protein
MVSSTVQSTSKWGRGWWWLISDLAYALWKLGTDSLREVESSSYSVSSRRTVLDSRKSIRRKDMRTWMAFYRLRWRQNLHCCCYPWTPPGKNRALSRMQKTSGDTMGEKWEKRGRTSPPHIQEVNHFIHIQFHLEIKNWRVTIQHTNQKWQHTNKAWAQTQSKFPPPLPMSFNWCYYLLQTRPFQTCFVTVGLAGATKGKS